MLVMALTLIQTAITETVRLLNINTLNSKKLNYITKKVQTSRVDQDKPRVKRF